MQKLFNRLKKIKWRNLIIFYIVFFCFRVVFPVVSGLYKGHDAGMIFSALFNDWRYNISTLILVTILYTLFSLEQTKES